MRVLITGAAGMLGNDVYAAALAAGHEPIALSRAELDICNEAAVDSAITSAHADAVINCAAYTNVDQAESSREQADAINGTGAGNVAAAAARAGAWTIHVSTDYVFDGAKPEPYVESDPVGPASAYGSSKLAGERAVARAAPNSHTIVRSSWLFGTAGPCFPATIMRIASERDEITVVDDQRGCPTFTGHLAPALVALTDGSLPGVAHIAGGGQCSWYEFAREIVNARRIECEVRPVSTAEFPRPAPRPANSVLVSERGAPRLPDWREGLGEYLAAGVGTR